MSIIAYKLLIYNDSKELLGNVTGIESLQWLEEYADAGEVKLVCAKTDNNVDLLKNNLLLHNTARAHLLARIDTVEYTSSDTGAEYITVRAKFTVNDWNFRVLLEQDFPSTKNAELALYEIANTCERQLDCAIAQPKNYTNMFDIEFEQGSAFNAMKQIAQNANLGIAHTVNSNLEQVFTVYTGVDRTNISSEDYNGYFAVSAGNLNMLTLTNSSEDYCNYAVIQSGDEDKRTVHLDSSQGQSVREVYFYASDIKKNYTIQTSSGTTQSKEYTNAEIDELLKERAAQLLQDKKQTIIVNANLNQSVMLFGTHYNVGDILPIVIYNPAKMCVGARLLSVKIIYEQNITIQATLQVTI